MTSTPEQQKIEERKGIIVIGMISSGKSTFLNSLLGITYLESKDDVTTKFVTIIRYNENLKEPKMYHLKAIKEESTNDKKDDHKDKLINIFGNKPFDEVEDNYYYFVKDGEESIGQNNIIKKIEEINREEKENKEPKYENLFYVLETNITNIENKEFLKTHDFYDIPGLNEYIVSDKKVEKKEEKKEEKQQSSNPRSQTTKESKEEMRYIKGIFQFLKKKIEREIIIFSSETYYKPQNLQIIEEIQKELNISLCNNLVILNKIDICEDREKTIADCKQFFVNNLESEVFNIFQNVFVPLNSMQFKNEILMKTNYENYYLYYLNKYIEKYVRIKDEEAKKIKKIPFVEYIINELTYGKKKEQKQAFINEMVSKFDDDKLSLIKSVYEKVKKNLNYIIDYGINFDVDEDDEDEDQSLTIIKAFYQNFEEKVSFPKYSEDVQIILDYFNNFKDESLNLEKAPSAGINLKSEKYDESKAMEILKDTFEKLKKNVKEDDKDNIINILSNNLIMMEKFIYNGRKIYIPFIGVSSAGKSTILNCIVGYKLFPEAQNECTTRGIIIEYSNVVELYETQIDSEKNYYVFSPKKRVAEGYRKVRDYLKSLNCRYSTEERKHFYIVKTTIKCFDDFEFSDELKKRILLVDLPGSDTKDNQFNQKDENQRSVYEKLLSISSSFIYINKGRAITETANQKILKELYIQIQDTSKLGNNDYLKACLFSINLFTKVTDEELDETKIKKDLSKILFDKEDNYQQINSVFFNAKNFYDYLVYSTLLQDHEASINKFEEKYRVIDDSSFMKVSNFPKYILKQLKQQIKDFGIKYKEPENCSAEFLQTIETIIVGKMKQLDEPNLTNNDKKTIKQIANIFNWLKDEDIYKEMDVYKNSFCHQFLNILKHQIELSKRYKDEEFIKKLKESLQYFDTFFARDIHSDNLESDTKKQFKEKKEELKKKLEDNFINFTIKDLFKQTKDKLELQILDYKKQIKPLIEKGVKREEIINWVTTGINDIINNFTKSLNERIKQFDKNIQNLIEDINNFNNFFNQLQLEKNEQFKNNFNRLLNAGKNININKKKEDKDEGFFSSIIIALTSFWNSIVDFFSFWKGEDEEIIEKIEQLRNEIISKLEYKERIINFDIEDETMKIKENFNAILALAFTDLSNIEEQKWIESKESYKKAKKILLPDENYDDKPDEKK